MLAAMVMDVRDLVLALRARLEALHGRADLVETHISWVLLAGPHAYKLKKPVRFGFLDFSSAEARRRCCEEELRLNRRLVPQLYRAVVDVRLGPDGPDLFDAGVAGEGERVDSALWMHRFPDDALASARLTAGRLTLAHMAALGRRLAAFHAAAPAAPIESPHGRLERVRDDVLKAVDALAALLPAAASAEASTVRMALERQLERLAQRLLARRAQGWVREGHGDLHLANVLVLGDEVTAFDCIEFDEGLRWTDTMADLAFVWMDLQAHGRDDLAAAVLDAYLEAMGDFDGVGVLRFFAAYRAIVRGLVTALRPQGGAGRGPQATDYLSLATRLLAPKAAALAITHGLPGSGKSWLAQHLLAPAGAVRIRSDVERKRQAGLAATADSSAIEGAVDRYTPAAKQATYSRLLSLADDLLTDGWPVILDAAWLRRGQREAARALAARHDVPFAVYDCHAPMALLRERVGRRRLGGGDASEADEQVLAELAARAEPLDAGERIGVLAVQTDQEVDVASLARRWMEWGAPHSGSAKGLTSS